LLRPPTLVAVSVFELDLKGAVVEEFGIPFALDFVPFLASGPAVTDRVAGVFDFETGLKRRQGRCRRLKR
jgi:hypothetical protein